MIIRLVFLSLVIGHFLSIPLYSQNKVKVDSVEKYIELSQDSNFNLNERLNFALKSNQYANEIGSDSIQLVVQRNLSLIYFFNEEYEKYVSINKDNFNLALKLNDTSAITVTTSNLGSYYRYTEQNDSSYFYYSKALKYYPVNLLSEKKAEAFLFIADIQQIEKAYIGAEEDAINAIKILNQLPETEDALQLYWNLYNLMAVVSENLTNYKEALNYHNQSIGIAEKMDNGFIYEVYSINNKAEFFRKTSRYGEALELYNGLIELRLKYEEEDPTFFPTIIINIGKTKFESGDYDFDSVEQNFILGYNISSKLDHEYTKMHAALELSKLYVKHDLEDLVIKYGNEALEIADEVSSNEYKMEALLTLSKVYEGDKGKDLLLAHIKLADSLLKEERAVQNKFARIEYDTEQIEAENQQISKENIYLTILSVGLLLTALLIYILISQSAKNKQLRMVQSQQEANEEIYNLMLNQQDKVDEARAQEKIRVSKELHDGVLGRLFGTRLSLDSLNFVEGKEAILNRANYIGQLKTIEEDIRKISHDMNADFVSGSGFMDIVTELIETQTKAYSLTYDFKFTDDISWEVISNKTKINIYRIIQESMQNIYKHADAKHLIISILLKKGLICIDLKDDGKGFDASRGKKGIGLKNMSSRVEEVNGTINFSSEFNKGTIVAVKIPYLA